MIRFAYLLPYNTSISSMEDIKLRKEWFVQSGNGEIEDNYDIDERNVIGVLRYRN